jgi:hypothetical protein
VFEERTDIGTPVAANLTGEFRLQIGNPDVIAPTAGIDHNGMRAFVVAAISMGRVGPPGDRISPRVIFCSRCIALNSAKNLSHSE